MLLVLASGRPHPPLGGCSPGGRAFARVRWLGRVARGPGIAQMPLTTLQKEVLRILAANRSEESHFAGGVVINHADDSARYSHDFDIFHGLAGERPRAANRA